MKHFRCKEASLRSFFSHLQTTRASKRRDWALRWPLLVILSAVARARADTTMANNDRNLTRTRTDNEELAAAESREFADYLEQKQRDGWQLRAPVDDDWGFIHHLHARPVRIRHALNASFPAYKEPLDTHLDREQPHSVCCNEIRTREIEPVMTINGGFTEGQHGR